MAEIRAATLDDAEQIHALLDARSRAAVGASEATREQVAWDLRRLGVDRWVAIDGHVVGYAQLTSTQELVHAAADPAVGDDLFARVQARADERGFDRIEAIVLPEDAPFHELVERHGFAHQRDVLRMWRHLNGATASPHWQDGLHVRSYEPADSERVHALLDDAYSAWDTNYVAQAHDEWLQFMTDHAEFDPRLWFLVERDGDLVACALHWKEHDGRGWVKDIVVRADERGSGIGKALLLHAFNAYAQRGVERVGLKVDSTNPSGALRLYDAVGFEIDRRYGIWNKHL